MQDTKTQAKAIVQSPVIPSQSHSKSIEVMNAIGSVGVRRVLRACRGSKSTSHSTENMSQMSAFPLKDCSCLPNSLCVWETRLPSGLLFRNIAFCGVWREDFTNSLLRRKNVDFLFPFSAVNSNSNHTSRELSKAMILLVKPLVSWLRPFCL